MVGDVKSSGVFHIVWSNITCETLQQIYSQSFESVLTQKTSRKDNLLSMSLIKWMLRLLSRLGEGKLSPSSSETWQSVESKKKYDR